MLYFWPVQKSSSPKVSTQFISVLIGFPHALWGSPNSFRPSLWVALPFTLSIFSINLRVFIMRSLHFWAFVFITRFFAQLSSCQFMIAFTTLFFVVHQFWSVSRSISSTVALFIRLGFCSNLIFFSRSKPILLQPIVIVFPLFFFAIHPSWFAFHLSLLIVVLFTRWQF